MYCLLSYNATELHSGKYSVISLFMICQCFTRRRRVSLKSIQRQILDPDGGYGKSLLFADETHFLIARLVVPFGVLIRPDIEAVLYTVHVVRLARVPQREF